MALKGKKNQTKPVKNDSEKKHIESLETEQLREIRQLLFGQEVASLKSALEKMEKEFSAQLKSLALSTENAFNQLREDLNENLDQVKQHHSDDSSEHLSRENGLEDSIISLDDKFNNYQKLELAKQAKTSDSISREIDKLRDELHSSHQDAMAQLKSASDELKNNKADKNTLASMLAEMATNLQGAKSKG